MSGSTPIGEQSPGTYRSRPPSLTSACAITTCGQGSHRRRCGGCGRPGALGASFSRPRVPQPRSPAKRGSTLPAHRGAGRGARSEPPGPRVAEASRAPAHHLPGSGALCPPRHQPLPVVSSPAALAAVAGSGSPASAQVGSAGGRRPGEPARPGGRSAAPRCAPLPALSPPPGLARPGPRPPVPGILQCLGEKGDLLSAAELRSCSWATPLRPPRATARDQAYSHAHPPQRDCPDRKAGVRLLLPPPQPCLWPGAPPPSLGIPGGSIPFQGSHPAPAQLSWTRRIGTPPQTSYPSTPGGPAIGGAPTISPRPLVMVAR